MQTGDTSLGGPSRDFPKTTWGMISGLRHPPGWDREEALESLCRRYWKPVYRFLRAVRAKTNDDAKDLTQDFLIWLADSEALKKFDADKGSFRRYLKVLLGGFVNDHDKGLRRLKRGGGVALVGIDDEEALAAPAGDAASTDPGAILDRAWFAEVVRQSVDRVRARLDSEGRAQQVRVYEAYEHPEEAGEPTYESLAARFGLKPGDVRNHIFAVREAIRAEVRAQLAEVTADDRDLEEEWNDLFKS